MICVNLNPNIFLKAMFLLLVVSNYFPSAVNATTIDPRERIFFWKENYTELTPANDSRVKLAQDIFNQLIQITGKWPEKEPKLYFIKETPYNITLPIALPDGWIVLSKNVLDICFQEKEYALDRLAFILAHEISHHKSDDFWHIKFFQTLASSEQDKKNKRILRELKNLTTHSEKIIATELRADELAIVYMLIAGFDTDSIVSNKNEDSFFDKWLQAVNPNHYTKLERSLSHPDAKQRTFAVRARLHQVIEKGHLFNLGLWYYQAGEYENAILAFDHFRQFYPGREVIHNLATSYHQLAIQNAPSSNARTQKQAFQFSLTIDPVNRSRNSIYRSASKTKLFFNKYLKQAIKHYQQAIELDPTYLPAYNNLASAYLLNEQPYQAIAKLQDAEQISANDIFLLNNMGIAFYMSGSINKAKSYLKKALNLNADYAPPLYNYSIIAEQEGNHKLAQKYRSQYLAKNDNNTEIMHTTEQIRNTKKSAADNENKPLREMLANVEVGTFIDEVSKIWKKPHTTHKYILSNTEYQSSAYDNGIITVAEGDEIRILVASSDYHGTTRKDIGIGHTEQDIVNKYGDADTIYWSTQGKRLAYHEQGITFYLSNSKVTGWQLYWN